MEPDTHGQEAARPAPTPIREDLTPRGRCCASSSNTGSNRRKMEPHRKAKATAARRATDAQVLEDAERLIADWNERQARQMPLLFARRSARRRAGGPLLAAAPSTTIRHERDQPHPGSTSIAKSGRFSISSLIRPLHFRVALIGQRRLGQFVCTRLKN
jgi:hypothetical protein